MFTTLYNFISTVSNALFDTFYICAWFYFLSREFYRIFVYPLKQDIETLKSQQDILYQAIKKLKDIIDFDNNSFTKQSSIRFKRIKSDLDSMYHAFGKRLDKIEEKLSNKYVSYDDKSEEEDEEDEYEEQEEEEDQEDEYEDQEDEEEDEDEEEKDEEDKESNTSAASNNSKSDSKKCILPIQNHITFPKFRIYRSNNNKNDKKTVTKLLSNQLCEFLGCEQGTNMVEEDVYALVFKRIKGNKKMTRTYKIKIVPKLQKLFGITENEDYEITPENLPKFIKPHLK